MTVKTGILITVKDGVTLAHHPPNWVLLKVSALVIVDSPSHLPQALPPDSVPSSTEAYHHLVEPSSVLILALPSPPISEETHNTLTLSVPHCGAECGTDYQSA